MPLSRTNLARCDRGGLPVSAGVRVALALLAVLVGMSWARVCPARAPSAQAGAAATALGEAFAHELGEGELRAAQGDWRRNGAIWRQEDAARYDLTAWSDHLLTGRYTLEVEIRHVAGAGGGLVFCSEKPEGPWHGEMIRFESPRSLLQGYFVRGEFVCRKVVPLPAPIDPAAWTALKLEVDGEARRVALHVGGRLVAEELELTYTCGHAGLQASESVAEFRAFRAQGRHADAPGIAWPRHAIVREGGVLLQSPALRRGWWIAGPEAGPELREGYDAREPAPAPPGYELQPGRVLHEGRAFAAEEVAPFDPVALFAWHGDVWAVDLARGRLVEVPAGGGGDVQVTFPAPGRARVELRAGEALRFERELDGLAPGSRHTVSVPQSYRTVPARTWTRDVSFQTPPAAGLCRARRIRVLAVICGNVFDNVVQRDADWPASEYQRIRRELEICREWYWVQSGFRLLLDIDYLHEESPLDAAGLTSEGRPYGRPRLEFIHAWAQEAGHDISRYQSVLVIQAYRRKLPGMDEWRMVGTGGGLTLGAHGRGYGISWWFVPEQAAYNAWLFCHEFHHQLDALFELSGHPEYWYNHFSPTIGTAADFGEHWDGNAHILREWPDWLWDALQFGDEVLLADADADGFPDAAPETPLDEKRFGSSPEVADTDGDGVSDAHEPRLRRTVDDSGFEIWGSPHALPDPRAADSDGDGVRDGEDPLPLLAFDPALEEGQWRRLGSIESEHFTAEVTLSVRARAAGGGHVLDLRFEGLRAADRSELRVLFDLGADGWFVGRDNAMVQLRPFVRGARPQLNFQDAASPGEWPHEDPQLAADFPLEHTGGENELVLSVRPSPRHGYRGRPGDRIQLLPALRSVSSRRAGLGWITFHEPHVLIPLLLPRP